MMARYLVEYYFVGRGTACIEAATEEEAERKFRHGEGERSEEVTERTQDNVEVMKED